MTVNSLVLFTTLIIVLGFVGAYISRFVGYAFGLGFFTAKRAHFKKTVDEIERKYEDGQV